MKTRFFYVTILLILSQVIFAQNITLNDLERFCNSQNWESVNQTLTNKGWDFHDSKRGDTQHYNTITWAFGRDYDDTAAAWFYLYTHQGAANKISYTVFNQQASNSIQSSLSSRGYVLKESHIDDGIVISVYQNNNFMLETSLEKRQGSGFYSTITGYNFTLIKKSGVYDPDNGKKVFYYYGDVKEMEYTLKEGEIDGEIIVYFENGKIKKRGFYRQGKEHGQFFEYDENGFKTGEYLMRNGELDGLAKTFLNNRISEEVNFKNDKKNGLYTKYFYNENDGNLLLKLTGQYLNDTYNGLWEYRYVGDGAEELFAFTTYSNGKKNGPFQDVQGDSLVIGRYRNDQLHGKYTAYLDFTRMLLGGKFNTDTTKLALLVKGNYLDGKKNGVWHFYDITGSLGKQGRYNNDQKTGEWRYYYPQMTDTDGNSLHYSGELYQIATYQNDQLNGQSQRFSYLERTPKLCDADDPMVAKQDTCWNLVYRKILETINLKDGYRHGWYEFRDSTDQVISSGNYFNNLREGEWVHRYLINDEANDDLSELEPVEFRYYFHKGNYRNGKEEGEWTESILGRITRTWQYRNGELQGKSTIWNEFNKPDEERDFINGKLSGLIVYDSLGHEPLRKYEIKQRKCTYTEFFVDGYITQEYWIGDLGEENPDFFDFYFSILSSDESGESRVYPDGEFRIADYDERPLITGTLKKENRLGRWTYYFYDQDVRIDVDYENDEQINERYSTLAGNPFSGKFKYVDDEEGTLEIRSVKNGQLHGNTDLFDQKTGKRITRERYRQGELR